MNVVRRIDKIVMLIPPIQLHAGKLQARAGFAGMKSAGSVKSTPV